MNIGDVPDLNGQQQRERMLEQWINNQPYYPRNLITVVLRCGIPEVDKDSNVIAQTIRSLLELHSSSIKGLNTSFRLKGSLDKQVTFEFNERYGRPIDKFLIWWYSKYRKAWYRGDVSEDGTIDVMFIEPDPTHTKVSQAFFMYDMHPVEYSGIESARDLTRATVTEEPPPTPKVNFWKNLWRRTLAHLRGDRLRYAFEAYQAPRPKPTKLSVTFGGEVCVGPLIDEHAQSILEQFNVVGANPYNRAAFIQQIAAEVTGETQEAQGSSNDSASHFSVGLDEATLRHMRYAHKHEEVFDLS